jgi:predicted  nucleic acid-binding Zn-ribbon protein
MASTHFGYLTRENAMATSKKLKELLDREIELLGEARDELKKQLKVSKGDAKKEWATLETKWKRIGKKSETPAKEIEGAARKLMAELKKGYSRIKREVEK